MQSLPSEKTIWEGRTSQTVNIPIVFLSILISSATYGAAIIILGPYCIWRFLVVRGRRYQLTNERLLHASGVFNIKEDQVELYRVKDIRLDKPFLLRIFGLGNLTVLSSDYSAPRVKIIAISNPNQIRLVIREAIENRRRQMDTKVLEWS